MKIMPCPLNGPRNMSEFAYLGEVVAMPDPNASDDVAWADHIWLSDNAAGVVHEWWCHVPTSYCFIAERDTVTDEILRTYPADEVFRTRVDFAARDES
ncbi:MAG TPA: sarcosine oxidase subunit delta [Kiloniellales bacterium]|nr:sarcosine oxidase subunit delta [Kiloniellales bacterium]